MGGNDSKNDKLIAASMQILSIPKNFLFAWLDTSMLEYPAFKASFCAVTNCVQQSWHMFKNESELDAFIRTIVPPKKLVLISAGRLAQTTVPNIYNLEQLHSVYIFCRDVALHEQWSKPYEKVRGVFSNSRFLLTRVRIHLANEAEGGGAGAQGTESQPVLLSGEEGRIFCFHINSYEKWAHFSIDDY
jgi:hypothetical protein